MLKALIISFFYCFSSLAGAAALDSSTHAYLDAFFSHYRRPLTVIEFSEKSEVYAKKIARDKKFDALVTLILWGAVDKMDARRAKENIGNLLVMRPMRVTPPLLEKFGKCEHPDVVLVHDIPNEFRQMILDFIQPFLGIGDYLGIDLAASDMPFFKARYAGHPLLIATIAHASGDGGAFAFFRTEKKGTVVPRWNEAKNDQVQEIRYIVTSSFTEKKMYKPALKRYSPWKKGINLLSAVMLGMEFPDDGAIVKAVEKLWGLRHNDLVMSNLVIQNDMTLLPIDWNDPRHDISRGVCLNALIDAFSEGRDTFESPRDFVEYYRELLDSDTPSE